MMIEEPTRSVDLIRFYGLLERLNRKVGGVRTLQDHSKKSGWPQRGVYFFFDPNERRTDTGNGCRVIRVGTHAVSKGSKSTLWDRLAQHKGNLGDGGGNHRGSIFREHIGRALIARDQLEIPSWGGRTAPREVRQAEFSHEQTVSSIIGQMPFLWLEIEDEPGKNSLRALIESNSIALLSNYKKQPIDPLSSNWLGNYRGETVIAETGLWNVRGVKSNYVPSYLNTLERLIEEAPEK